jgi:hypothetical protein
MRQTYRRISRLRSGERAAVQGRTLERMPERLARVHAA